MLGRAQDWPYEEPEDDAALMDLVVSASPCPSTLARCRAGSKARGLVSPGARSGQGGSSPSVRSRRPPRPAAGPIGCRLGRHRATTMVRGNSGIGDLEEAPAVKMLPRAHLIKAARVLGQLSQIARKGSCYAALDLIEEAELEPVMHPLAELDALHNILLTVPQAPQRAQLEALLAGLPLWQTLGVPDPGPGPESRKQLVAAAREAASRARGEATLAVSPVVGMAAGVLARSYQSLAHS